MASSATKKAESTPAKKEPKKISVVKYIGTSDVRIIRREDWDAVGDDDHDERVWSATNRWQIGVDKFSDAALAYLSEVDDEFVIVDLAVDLTPEPEANPHPDITY